MARIDDLTALREQLQEWLREAPVDRVAALVAQYRATLQEIDELTPKEPTGDSIDEIAARRAARRSGSSSDSGRSKRSG